MLDLVMGWDYALRQMIGQVRWPPLDALMFAFSYTAQYSFIWLLLAALAVFARPSRARGAWQMVLAIVVATLVVAVVKPVVNRPRPFRVPIAVTGVRTIGPRPADASFPSKHATVAAAAAVALGRAWPGGRAALWLIAALVAFSRVYIGVHYPLDVLVGLLIGWLAGSFVVGRTAWYSVNPLARADAASG